MNRRILQKRSLFVICTLLLAVPTLYTQTTTLPQRSADLTPGPKPPDARAEWKRHVGIYEYTSDKPPKSTVIILEREHKLYLRYASGKEVAVSLEAGLLGIPEENGREWTYSLDEEPGEPELFSYLNEGFSRTDAGSDPSHYYHITPSKPIAELRAAALAAKPPLETQPFRRPDLVELVTLDPTIHLDIRYAQSNNFLSTPVYTQARAFLQRPAAQALVRVSQKLHTLGYGLLIHDAYRPWYVTKIFWDATPPKGRIFVADPKQGSKHNRGCAVDLTLYDFATGKPAEMPGLYDEMSPRSFPTFPGGTSLQRWQRDLLRRAMESEGFTVNESEWWHFDYRDWKDYKIMNERFEDLGAAEGPREPANGGDLLHFQCAKCPCPAGFAPPVSRSETGRSVSVMRLCLSCLGARKKVSQFEHQCGRRLVTLHTNFSAIPVRLTRKTSLLLHSGQLRPLLIHLKNMSSTSRVPHPPCFCGRMDSTTNSELPGEG